MSVAANPLTLPFPQHDHSHCIRTALESADAVCAARGVRLTPLRRRVLELVWQGHAPVGAYALLEKLKGDGHSAAPPTVYRALEFLMAQGLVHRLASLNAFVGCVHPGEPHAHQHLICRKCQTVIEIADAGIAARAREAGEGMGFIVESQTVELVGLCQACR
ncbi:MAG: transcriptional repressor [Alphaproteobacteria bacterium]|nr:Fur family transcriptional regulator [Alphaproteobacteria bacterium]TAD88858.1 MAG: transcriptional repressor [Alphaproteobacteria bacterium]